MTRGPLHKDDDDLERRVRALLETDSVQDVPADSVLRRRERATLALAYLRSLSLQGVLDDREQAW